MRVPPLGGMETERADAAEEPGKDVEVPLHGGGDVRGGRAGGGYLLHPSS